MNLVISLRLASIQLVNNSLMDIFVFITLCWTSSSKDARMALRIPVYNVPNSHSLPKLQTPILSQSSKEEDFFWVLFSTVWSPQSYWVQRASVVSVIFIFSFIFPLNLYRPWCQYSCTGLYFLTFLDFFSELILWSLSYLLEPEWSF